MDNGDCVDFDTFEDVPVKDFVTQSILKKESFTNSLPSETAISMRTSIPKIEDCVQLLVICSDNL